jgi:hypothetical protein
MALSAVGDVNPSDRSVSRSWATRSAAAPLVLSFVFLPVAGRLVFYYLRRAQGYTSWKIAVLVLTIS